MQLVKDPTHISGGTLDLVLTCSNACDSIQLSDIQVIPTVKSSDHYIVSFSCLFPHCNSAKIFSQNLKDIDLEEFEQDIQMSALNNPEEFGDLNNAVNIYNTHLEMLLNTHAPIKSIKFNAEQSIWFEFSCQDSRGSTYQEKG